MAPVIDLGGLYGRYGLSNAGAAVDRALALLAPATECQRSADKLGEVGSA